MAQLATCPFCTTQLALPDGTTLSDRARCPRCEQEFLLMETVQFSIPTAEILPPAPSAAADAPEPTPTQEFAPEAFAREIASEVAGSSEGYEVSQGDFSTENTGDEAELIAAQEFTPEPAPTLSDWEARLKRAMADDIDEVTQTGTVFPTFVPQEAISPPLPAETFQPCVPHDFAIPETDLVPEQQPQPVAQDLDDWSPDDYIDKEDLTVTTTADQTVSNYIRDEEEPAVSVVAAPRNKRKRSVLRTLASISLGVIGIPIGLYVLLWLRGPAGDVVNIAKYLPPFMLPASFDNADSAAALVPEQIVQETPATNEAPPLADSQRRSEAEDGAAPLVRDDPDVAPASAEEPMYHGPTFDPVSGSKFVELLTAAETAAPQLAEGDLASKESVARKGQAYMALARLADRSSFLNQPGLAPEETTKTLLARQLFETTLRDEDVQRDLPQIALRWWQYAQRPSTGMVLTGRVERLQPTEAGPIAYISLDTEPVAPEIPVLIGETMHHEGEVIGVVGSIMANPQERIPAIGIPSEPILIAHYSFPLNQPARTGSDSQLLQLTQ